MSTSTATVSFEWGEVSGAFVLGSLCFLSCFHVIHHRTGAYGLRNWAVMLTAALLFTIALFVSTALTLLAVTLDCGSPVSSSLPLTVDPVLLSLAFCIPFVFILFGCFLAAHPDSHRYCRLPAGVAAIAVGTTASQFLTILALHSQATFTVSPAWAAGVVLIGLLAVPAVLCVLLRRQQRYAVNAGVELSVSIAMGLSVEAMHVMALQCMQWSYDATATVASPLHPLLYPLSALSVLSVIALTVSIASTRYAASKDRQASSRCFTVSAFMMDAHQRVLMTVSGHLPSMRMETEYQGQGAFDSFNRDFLLMLSTSLHWRDAFTTMYQLTAAGKEGGAAQSSVLVFSQFVHACCHLAHSLQVSLSQLGFLYCAPVDDRLLLISSTAHAGRMTESGLYRWVPREVAEAYLRSEHGALKHDSNDKMIKLLGDDYAMQESERHSWVAELQHYYTQFQLGIEQRAAAPDAAADIAITIPSLSPQLSPAVPKLEAAQDAEKTAVVSPRSRSVTLSGFKLSGPVSPVSAVQAEAGAAVEKAAERERGASMPSMQVVRAAQAQMQAEQAAANSGSAEAQQRDGLPAAQPEDAQHAVVPAVSQAAEAGAVSDGCQIYLGMFLARITGQQLSVLISRQGPSHIIPCVRLRMRTAGKKAELTEAERVWLQEQMDNAAINQLPVTATLDSAVPLAAGSGAARFASAFYSAAAELSALLGGGKHVAFGRLLSVHPFVLSPTAHLLVCCESVMTPHFPAGYDRHALTFMPRQVFETLSAARWPQCRPADWVSKCLLSTARSFDRRSAWLMDRELLLSLGTSTRLATVTERSAAPRSLPTSPLRSVAGSQALSATASKAASKAASKVGSPAVSRRASARASGQSSPHSSAPDSRGSGGKGGSSGDHTRASSYEMKKTMAVMNGKLVMLVSVKDAEEEREKAERRTRRRERKMQREARKQAECKEAERVNAA